MRKYFQHKNTRVSHMESEKATSFDAVAKINNKLSEWACRRIEEKNWGEFCMRGWLVFMSKKRVS